MRRVEDWQELTYQRQSVWWSMIHNILVCFLVRYSWGETSMFMQRWCRINLDHLLHMHLWQYFKISSWCVYPAQSHMAKVIVTCIHLSDAYETIIHVFRSNQFNTSGCWCPGPHIARTTAAMLLTVRRCWQIHRPNCPGSQDIVDVRKLPQPVKPCFSEHRASYQHIEIILNIQIAVVSWKTFSWVPVPAKNICIETSFRLQCHILQLVQI